MTTRTWTTITLLLIAILAGPVQIGLPVAAQDDEDQIGETVNVTLPGFEASVSGFVGNLAPMPSTPIDPLRVHSPFPPLNLTVGDVQEERVCLVDDDVRNEVGLEDDTLPCEVVVKETLTSTCDTMFSALRAIPHVGAFLADTLEQTAEDVDESVSDALGSAYDMLPDQVKNNIGEPEWNTRAHDAVVHCSGELQSVRSLTGTDPSRLIIDLGVDIDVCPWPEVIPHCEPVSDSIGGPFATEGNTTEFSQNPCSFENLIFDCGKVKLENETLGLDHEVDPFEHWNQVVENLSAHLKVDLQFNDYDQSTPRVTEAAVGSSGGGAGCDAGGLPPNSGVIPGSWTLDGSASMVGGDFPFWEELQEEVNPLLVLVFETVNDALDNTSTAWSKTMNDIVATINDTWNEEDEHEIAGGNFSIGEALGLGALHDDGGDLVLDCEQETPQTEANEPGVEHEHLENPPLPP